MIDYIDGYNEICPKPSGLRVISTRRSLGCSSPPYASLNLGHHVGDSEQAVAENRRLLELELGLKTPPLWLNQVHGTRIIDVADCEAVSKASSKSRLQTPPEADGFYCNQPNTACAILTADCLPLVISRTDGSAFVCLHVGWKGLVAGIIEKGTAQLVSEGDTPVDELTAWAGPCIGPDAFEVGQEVRDTLGGPDAAWRKPIPVKATADQKWLCDLYTIVGERLKRLGVSSYSHAQACTFLEPERYFSYRRDGITGRQATIVWSEISV